MDKKQKKIFAVIVSVAVVSAIIIFSIILLSGHKEDDAETNGRGYDGDTPEASAVTDDSAADSREEAPENIITDVLVNEMEEDAADAESSSSSDTQETSVGTFNAAETSAGTSSTGSFSSGTVITQESADIHIKNRGDASNMATPMVFKNMFPGDSISQTYTLTVDLSVKNSTSPVLYFYCSSRDASDMLLLNGIELNLVQNGQTVWKGTAAEINGVGKSLVQKLYSINPGTSGNFTYKWDVEITASIPTSAGNEYQNLKAILDFYWMVGVEGDVTGDDIKDVPVVSPKTGDQLHAAIWAVIVIAALFFIIIIVIKLRKKDDEHESQQSMQVNGPASRL